MFEETPSREVRDKWLAVAKDAIAWVTKHPDCVNRIGWYVYPRVFDDATIRELYPGIQDIADSVSKRETTLPGLQDTFSQMQLDLLESVFFGRPMGDNWAAAEHLIENLANAGGISDPLSAARIEWILNNIITNDGVFRPDLALAEVH